MILALTMLFAFGTAAVALAAPKGEPPGQARKRVEIEAEKGIQAGEAVRERDREREGAASRQVGPGQKSLEVRQREQTRNRLLNPEEKALLHGRPLEERLRIRGMNLKFDVPPVIKYGRTLVPVRAISQGLGAQVAWDPETMTVTITRDDTVITLALGLTYTSTKPTAKCTNGWTRLRAQRSRGFPGLLFYFLRFFDR